MRDFEARLWRAENRVERIELPTLAQRVAAIEPTIWQLWGRAPVAAASTTATVTLNLTVLGANGSPLPGARCLLSLTNGGGTVGPVSATTDGSGQATFTLTMLDSSAITAGSLLVDKAGRFNPTTFDAVTDMGIVIGTNTYTADMSTHIASGFHAVPTGPDPVNGVAYIHDPTYGPITVYWVSGSLWSTGSILFDFGGGGTCSPIFNINVTYDLDFANSRVRVTYHTVSSTNDCPGSSSTTQTTDASLSYNFSGPYTTVPTWYSDFATPSGSKWWPSVVTLYVEDHN